MNFFHDLNSAPAFLLVVVVGVVGVLHTMVPDHWAPNTLIARQRGWTTAQTARAALVAGTGHVVSTLFLGPILWGAGLAVAAKFGQWIEILSSGALIGFGLWIAYSGWRECARIKPTNTCMLTGMSTTTIDRMARGRFSC